ncbi:hypothetical protein O2N63_08295 [Aliiroseovarius sp. KMU-50]|uniref:Lipoprotein n=2 Tax=Aliiroseovarius salicola TaxID=3009082 RepID=A0ABT4W0P5_9RHOB|nr:hypothetical protein [Aliiroseovarius sp. KMU-50]MDA5094088.1 hypothetical protein [Aliiroseovarius sp. KMU-50]
MLTLLSACVQPTEQTEYAKAPFTPEYLGIETQLLDGDLVNFRVAMKGARGQEDVAGYARCAAAQYALIRGYGFARHVRTTVDENGKRWTGDAAYVISAALPDGIKTIDAEVTVQNCLENGIPTV